MSPENTQQLKQQVAALPVLPGVYFFKGADGAILYVGKAKHLKKRVSNYLQKNHTDWKTAALMSETVDVDHRITDSELDAMVLEAQLIRTHKPPFNVLLKGSSPFLYFFFPRKTAKTLPTFQLQRGRDESKSGTWVGPFLTSSQARKLFHALTQAFQLKICGKKIPGGCLYFHMQQCSGSCRDDFDKDAYVKRLEKVKKLCTVGPKTYIKSLEKQIKENTKNLEFEQAQSINDHKELIVDTLAELHASHSSDTMYEVFARGSDIWILDEKEYYLHLYNAYQSNLTKVKTFFLDTADQAEEFFLSYYREVPIPGSIFTNITFEDSSLIESFFNLSKDLHVSLVVIDKVGQSYSDMVQLTLESAQSESKRFRQSAHSLSKLLKTDKPIHTVDCFDVSHKSGTDVVAACIRFCDGRPEFSKFRQFKMMSDVGNNDYANLQEAVSRRYRGGKDIPDLILIDGGKGQLNAVKDLVPGALFASLAKREERVFADSLSSTGYKLDEHTVVGRLLIALRDYTHHFAISYHRKRAQKRMQK